MILCSPIVDCQLSPVNRQGFVETLPDVAGSTTMDGGLALIPYIYKNKVALTNLQGLQLDGQLLDAVGAEGLATLHEWAVITFG